ncbi:MAG: hypothetical protein JWP03_188 [Phycisphaerales bacterium]|nr:hypothetical protein [Phycisphaerales bacterium]
MRHHAFSLASALSLLLCAATCALWVRSTAMKTGDRLGWTKVAGEHGRRAELSSVDGHIAYVHDTATTPFISAGYADAPGAGWEHGDPEYIGHKMDAYTYNDEGDRHEWGHLGVYVATWNNGCMRVSVEDGVLALITAPLPALWIILRLRLLFRPKPGCCPTCGYDLCATPNRCPECGAVPADIRP